MPTGERRVLDGVSQDVRPYFFLSYARTPKRDPADRDNPDRWVHKLYRDLCDAILQMTDVQPAEAGFMDVENKVGAEWSPALIDAIKNCRVFVPLYSRRYFESDNCGREWFAFARREVTHRARGGERVDAIVPALWTRLDRRPDTRDRPDLPVQSPGPRRTILRGRVLRDHQAAELPRRLPAGGAPAGRADHRGRRQERCPRERRRAEHGAKGLRIALRARSGRPAPGAQPAVICR